MDLHKQSFVITPLAEIKSYARRRTGMKVLETAYDRIIRVSLFILGPPTR
jgi:hypothetical protein